MSQVTRSVPLGDRFLRRSFRRAKRHDVLGLAVAPDRGSMEQRAICLRKIEAALCLIHAHDPRRFQRIRQNIDGVFVYWGTGDIGRFHQSVRLVTLRHDYVLSPSTSIAEVASTLVHEGTHARLCSMGFDYSPNRRARIEAICHRSEIAFARRLPDPEHLIEAAESRLKLDRSMWSYEALQQRSLNELADLGLPPWFVALLARLLRLRDRVMRIWMGPPPDER